MFAGKGVFHVIATPIGNLSDITRRAAEVIGQLDLLYAEDTRHTARLCSHLGVNVKLRSLHDHNEQDRIAEVLEQLQAGLAVGLVSDAGTPLISDPGYRIVAACHAAGVSVSPVPGPSSLTAALSVSGLPTDRFLFNGFLPARLAARQKVLSDLKSETATLVFFESTHRIIATLEDLLEIMGDREIFLGRELTKTFETIIKARVSDVLDLVAEQHKGEFVLVVSGADQGPSQFNPDVERLLLTLATEMPPKQAAKLTSIHYGVNKKVLYTWLLDQKPG